MLMWQDILLAWDSVYKTFLFQVSQTKANLNPDRASIVLAKKFTDEQTNWSDNIW